MNIDVIHDSAQALHPKQVDVLFTLTMMRLCFALLEQGGTILHFKKEIIYGQDTDKQLAKAECWVMFWI